MKAHLDGIFELSCIPVAAAEGEPRRRPIWPEGSGTLTRGGSVVKSFQFQKTLS